MKRKGLPRLSRGWKVILSIPAPLIVVCFLVTMWAWSKKEQRNPVTEFRMAERSCWVGPSDIRYAGDHFGAVGTYMDQVVISNGRYSLEYWPRDPEGPTLVPLSQGDFLAVDVPEGTARAELTLELFFYYIPALSEPTYTGPTSAVREVLEQIWGETREAALWEDIYVVQGKLTEEGGVLFSVEPKAPDVPGELGNWDGMPLCEVSDRDIYAQEPWENGAWAQMEAVFYNESGTELGRAALNTPEGGETLAERPEHK